MQNSALKAPMEKTERDKRTAGTLAIKTKRTASIRFIYF